MFFFSVSCSASIEFQGSIIAIISQPGPADARKQQNYTGFIWVLENLESPGILIWHFPGLGSPGKRPLVLESSENLLNSNKKI